VSAVELSPEPAGPRVGRTRAWSRPLHSRTLPGLVVILALVGGCGGGDGGGAGVGPMIQDPGPVHVHGLGINPKDGALYIATHTGLFRAAPGESKARRVGDRYQDTMGFTVVGPDHFLGSGHPDGRDDLPPFLGLIESRDAGKTWKPISLLGKADFHVLEAEGDRVYGYGSDFDSRRQLLLSSGDGGRTWERRSPPEPLISLVPRRGDAALVVAAGEDELHLSRDGAREWTRLGGEPGLLAWPVPDRLYLVGGDGTVRVSEDGGRSWRDVGQIGGEPAAFVAEGPRALYAALHDGTVKRSVDGGASWTIRSRP
jgi:hypothetical protein